MTMDLIEAIFSAQGIFWFFVITGLLVPVLIYRVELKHYGGMGIATPLAATVVLYTLINPAMYMINPVLALNYAMLVGDYMTADTLLPGILCSVSFLVALLVTVKACPRVRLKDPVSNLPPSPLSEGSKTKLLFLSLSLCFIGIVFYIVRNTIAFGSPLGSLTSVYGMDTARPAVPIFSTCIDILGFAIVTSSILILWQVSARAWPKWTVFVPLLFAVLLSIGDGNRALIPTAGIFMVGWYGLRIRLRLRHLILGIVALSSLTLLANARYDKENTGFFERVKSIANVEYFRPFWSGDLYGPNVVVTLEALRIHDTGDISFGMGYLEAIPSVIPRFIAGGRWQTSTVLFAQNFQESRGEVYYQNTGFAYSAIAEAFVNFWYVGTVLLGVLCGFVSWKLMGFCSRSDQLGRALFSCFLLFIISQFPRNSITYYIAPLTLIQMLIIWYAIRLCARSQRRMLISRNVSQCLSLKR